MRNRNQIASLAAVAVAAAIFGMVLAGGIRLTSPSVAGPALAAGPESQPASNSPQLPVLSFADIAERVTPAVVTIKATEFIESSDSRGRRFQNPFEFFFRDTPRDRFHDREPERRDSGGSGFLISEDGFVITNFHVIEKSTRIKVEVPNRSELGGVSEYDAEIIGADPSTDLALLKLKNTGDERFPYLPLGDSHLLRVGDWVMAVGNPFLYPRSVTVGVVSAKGRVLRELSNDFSLDDYIQTDAAINFGNSGGPLVNTRGEVVGVNTAISVAGQGIGFAVPIDIAKEILDQLKTEGRVARGYLGIQLGPLDEDLAEALGLPSIEGALVNHVSPDLPAAKAGIRPGDVIVAVEGEKIRTTQQLVHIIAGKRPGDRVKVRILRKGKEREFTARLEDREKFIIAASNVQQRRPVRSEAVLGISVGELSADIRRSLDLDNSMNGVVVTDISQTSEAWEKGVRSGDVITEVNQDPIESVAEFREAIESAHDRRIVVLYVVNANSARFVTIRLQAN